MARFRFIGDPNDSFRGPAPQKILGFVFDRDDWTEVPDDLAERFARHSHLEQDETQAGAGDVPQPKRRGRPPKVREA
jgi:hypothetical protein